MMDRPVVKKRSNLKRNSIGGFIIFLFGLGVFILSGESSQRIDKDAVEIKSVQQGPFSVYAIGNGTVIPRDVDYLIPKVSGEIVSVNVKSGDLVEKGQILFVINNEEVMVEFGNQEIALAEAKAARASKEFSLETKRLQLQMEVLRARTAYEVQHEEYLAYKTLLDKPNPPISLLLFRQAEIRDIQLKKIYEIEKGRLDNFNNSMKTQLNEYTARVSLAENMLSRIRTKVDELQLKARTNGVVQDVDLKPGQRVEVGTVLALVSNPDEVYIRLKVSAVQGHKLAQGQVASVTFENKNKTGRVIRIDPNVKGTTIDVDIELDEEVKIRTNMFVSGKIVIEELGKALFVDAPPNAIENGTSSVYLLTDNGAHAQLRKVNTGYLSAGRIQIRDGLLAGDKIVVSDTGRFQGVERVALY